LLCLTGSMGLSFWFGMRVCSTSSAVEAWYNQLAQDSATRDGERALDHPAAAEEAEWPLDGCPTAESVRCTDAAWRRTAAVYIVGIKSRALLNTTMQRVLRRAIDDGFAVHVYLSLIYDASGTGNWLRAREMSRQDPAIERLSRRGLQRYLRDLVRPTGACVLCAEIPQRPQELEHIPENPGQLREFPPHNTSTGKRVLNMWLRREKMWNATLLREAATGKRYEFLMWVRDDAYWVGDIPRPSALMQVPDAARTMWTLRCGEWGGVNDRVGMFGRDAAPAMLTMFSGFMHGGFPTGTRNSEVHLLKAARAGHVVLQRSTYDVLPLAIAMVYDTRRGPALCLLRKYWCGNAAGVSGLKFCEDINQSKPGSTTTPRRKGR